LGNTSGRQAGILASAMLEGNALKNAFEVEF